MTFMTSQGYGADNLIELCPDRVKVSTGAFFTSVWIVSGAVTGS